MQKQTMPIICVHYYCYYYYYILLLLSQVKLEDVLGLLSQGFVRGSGGFLKAGGPELLKSGLAGRDVRVGVTMVSCQ